MTATATMLDAALDYARRGWRIFPVRRPGLDGGCSCGDPKCTIPGKHPHIKEWPILATTDETTIRRWWQQSPGDNIGHELTERIGLDVDPRHGGHTSLLALLAEIGPLPATPTVLTGGGGEMYLFDAVDVTVKNNAGDLAPGLDIRTSGGMVLLPPSLHRSGRRYEWEASSHPDDVPIAPIPARLLDRIKASQSRGGMRTGTPKTTGTNQIGEGQRNRALFAAGCALRRHGASFEAILAALLTDNAIRCTPPLPDEEVRKIATSAVGYDPAVTGPTFTASPKGHRPVEDEHEEEEANTDREGHTPILDAGNQELPEITALSWEALRTANTPPRLFRHNGLLGRLETDERGIPVVVTLTDDRLRHELARAATWYRTTKEGRVPAMPPVAIVTDLLATPAPPLPILAAIVEVPTFTRDGTLHITPGYDPVGQTFYAPPDGFSVAPIPQRPSQDDISQARAFLLDELLGDFPFVNDAERAHAVGLLLLPFARALISGPTPLHLIEKPQVGTGATLLADMLTFPAMGRPLTAMTEGRDEDEWRKRLTARLRSGPTAILIDNLREQLDAAALASALTATDWEDRLLGTSATIRVPVRCAWIATGNNPALSSEIARRTVRIRLDSLTDRPWLRRDFRHPDLREWAIAHRPQIVGSALTLIAAWLAEDQPTPAKAPRLGMFENWSRVIGGILDIAGITGFLANLEELYEYADTEGDGIRALLECWWDDHATVAVGAADLWGIVESGRVDLDLGTGNDRARRTKFGQFLTRLRDRHYAIEAGMVQVVNAGTKQRVARWRLQASPRKAV